MSFCTGFLSYNLCEFLQINNSTIVYCIILVINFLREAVHSAVAEASR